jgi:recombination protein RecR
MNFSSKILEDAVNALSALPGIGKKTALRLALHLIQDSSGKATKIATSLNRLSTEIRKCKVCCNISDHELCHICATSTRKNETICVVENTRDVMAIEETNQYSGKYHVLGGVISPLDGIGPGELSIDLLIDRIAREKTNELIMAISPTIEGETTIYYISKLLKDTDIKISVIARGVAFGGDLEYADELTLGRSIQSRIPYHIQSL